MNYTNLVLFLLGVLGVAIHNLMKMDEINRKANGDFKFIPYVKVEKFSIILSLCLLVVCTIVKQEIKQLESVGKWLGIAFVAIGYMAQSIIVKYAGKAENYINK